MRKAVQVVNDFQVRLETGLGRFFRVRLQVIDRADAIEQVETQGRLVEMRRNVQTAVRSPASTTTNGSAISSFFVLMFGPKRCSRWATISAAVIAFLKRACVPCKKGQGSFVRSTRERKRGRASFVRSTRRAVPANEPCPLFRIIMPWWGRLFPWWPWQRRFAFPWP